MGGKERATGKVIHIHSEFNNRIGVGKSVCLSILTWLCLVLNHVWLCNPMDYSPSGSSVHGILQARILEWVAMHSSRGSSQPKIKLRSPTLQADSLLSEPPGRPQIPEWVAYPFSRGSSQPRNQTGASCIAGRFTSWATREALRRDQMMLSEPVIQNRLLGSLVLFYEASITARKYSLNVKYVPHIKLFFIWRHSGLSWLVGKARQHLINRGQIWS